MPAIHSEIMANVWKVEVEIGQRVVAKDVVVILESMKMEIPVNAGHDGTVTRIFVAANETVQVGAPLVEIQL